ncbi:hypothetical protein PVT01_070043100 [Plasmodium vivax]|uniref:VIR protein n=1 Tax=Plasmodium vivax TaxID=5855 RepID=A0A1G4GVX8_PLAVI|nr:hypothetical protein PVT01_070043100 [Plasmodium vivax]
MGFITVNIINDGNTLTRPKCTDDYGDILDEIQDLKLDDDDDIKKFYATCKSNIECLSYISPKLEKAAALKDDTEISCEGDGECVEKAKAVKGEAGEGTSHPNEKDSGMQDLKTQKLRGQRGSHVDGKGPRIQQVIPHDQQDVKSQRTSVKTDLEEPDVKDNHRFSPPGPIEKRTPSLGVSTTPPKNALGTNPNDPSPQSGSEEESPSTGIPKEKTPETIVPQGDSHNSQTPNDNAHGSQGVDSQTDKTHPSVDRDVSMVSTTESRATGTSISGEHGDVVSPHTVADRADNYRTSVTPVGSANVRGSSVASADTLHGVNGINRGATTSERVVTKAADSVPVSSERSGSSIPAVGSDQRKVDNLENHGSHEDAGRALERETPHSAECNENTRGEGTACNKLGQLSADSSITNVGDRTQSSLSTSYANIAGEGSMKKVAHLKIRSNQDSTDANSVELHKDEISQCKRVTEQGTIDRECALQTKINQEGPQNKGDIPGTSQGVQMENHQVSEAGDHYLKDIHSQLTIYLKLY